MGKVDTIQTTPTEGPTPIGVINAVRGLSPLMRQICRNGSCYRLYLLLKEIFPGAEPYFDADYHVVTLIGNYFYDIDGEYKKAFYGVDLMTTAERERQSKKVADFRMVPVSERDCIQANDKRRV